MSFSSLSTRNSTVISFLPVIVVDAVPDALDPEP
jgi:hypothetical protein